MASDMAFLRAKGNTTNIHTALTTAASDASLDPDKVKSVTITAVSADVIIGVIAYDST